MESEEVQEIREACSQHVESQLDLHFCSIAEDFDVYYGDITPDQALRLSKIKRIAHGVICRVRNSKHQINHE